MMKGRTLAVSVFVAFAALVTVFAVSISQGGARKDLGQGLVGQTAPGFRLQALTSEGVLTPDTFKGRPYVVNFFASWCTPCLAEHPLLMQLERSGVPILGVAYKDDPPDTLQFLIREGDPFAAVGMDRQGRLGLEFGVSGVPETFVVGADGTLLALHRGPLTPEAVDRVIIPALKGETEG